MKIISADQRLAEKRGAKILIVGPTGVGKTSLLRTLDPARTLFVDIEAGDLSVLDVPVPTIRIETGPPRAISLFASADLIHHFPRPRAIRRRTTKLSAVRSKISIVTRLSSSIPSPPRAGFRSATPSSSPKRLRHAARRTCAAPTGSTGGRC